MGIVVNEDIRIRSLLMRVFFVLRDKYMVMESL